MSGVNFPNAPGTYVNVEQPPVRIQGVPTGIIGFVGTATWGPKNAPVTIGSDSELVRNFGQIQDALMDLVTSARIALELGANSLLCVRATDGTDVEATVNLMDTATPTPAEGMALTALYSGTVGNSITAAITAGATSGTYTLTITRPGYTPEVFPNIAGTGSALWQALVNAVNNGVASRGPSTLVSAAIPATPSTVAPNTSTTYTLAGGTNGNSSVTATTLVGSSASPRTGMYALSGTEAAHLVLCDNDDATTFPTMHEFASFNNMMGYGAGVAGQSISAGITFFNGSPAFGAHMKLLLGDWCYWLDTTNNVLRMLSPLAFAAARRATLRPSQSTLNKPIGNIVATQSSLAKTRYDGADMATLRTNGIDVIVYPISRGKAFGLGNGINSSLQPDIMDDSYTAMTNFLAATFQNAGGQFEGDVQTTNMWADEEAALSDFLSNLKTPANSPSEIADYDVIVDSANNPQSEVSVGDNNISVSVQYYGIAVRVIFTFLGGSSVVISNKAA